MELQTLQGKRCIGLTRSSSVGQAGDGLSNEQQAELLKQYAHRMGMIWVEEYRAEGVSASRTDKRQDIEDLLYRAETAKDYDVLVVQSYDRLTRGGAIHGGFLLFKFLELKIKIVSITNDIPDNEYAPVLYAIEFIKGNGTAKSISLVTLRGRTAALFDGRTTYCTFPPYAIDRLILSPAGVKQFRIRNLPDGTQHRLAWDSDNVLEIFPRNPEVGSARHFQKHVDQKTILVPGPIEAVEAVRLMYDMFYRLGVSPHQISLELTRRGIPSPRGKGWRTQTVDFIVHNSIYIQRGIANRKSEGIYHMRPAAKGEQPVRKNNPTKLMIHRPQSEWLMFPHPEITIIPPELHDDIWKRQVEHWVKKTETNPIRRDPSARIDTPYLLIGTIFDASTGLALKNHRSSGPYRYYHFPKPKVANAPKVRQRSMFPAVPLEKAVLDALAQVLGNVEEIIPDLERYCSERQAVTRGDLEQIGVLRAQREKKRSEKAFAFSQFSDLGEEGLKKLIAPLTAEIKKLDERIAVAERSLGISHLTTNEIVRSVVDNIKNISSNLDEASSAELRAIVKVFSKTVVDMNTLEATVEVRLPKEAMERKDGLKLLCESTDFTHQVSQDTQSKYLLLACFYGKKMKRQTEPLILERRKTLSSTAPRAVA